MALSEKIATFASNKSRTMLEDILLEDELFTDEPEQIWIVAEAPSRDYSLDNKRATEK